MIQIPKSAFPLSWPAGVPRSKYPESAPFHTVKTTTKQYSNSAATYKDHKRSPLENSAAYRDLVNQLNRIRSIKTVLVSSNLDINEKSGICYFDGPSKPNGDAGVAAYWTVNVHRAGQTVLVPYCMPCDKWLRVADNLSAVARSIEALRGMDRWGCVSVEQAFSGFAALPPGSGETVGVPSTPPVDWRVELSMGRPWPEGMDQAELLLIARTRYRQLMQDAHPDRPGGSQERASLLNRALESAEKELS